MSKKITGGIASIPNRQQHLHTIVSAILPQLDELHVFLNGYQSVPDFLINSKIRIYRSQEIGDLGDTGKFYGLINEEGFCLTFDDDILYPQNYVRTMINKVREYDYSAIICVHGNLLPTSKIFSYYKEKIGLHFTNTLKSDFIVDVPGTGTMAFHTKIFRPKIENFPRKNMTDLWLYSIFLNLRIPIISISREENWLVQLPVKDSIYSDCIQDAQFQTDLVNSLRTKRFRQYNIALEANLE